MQEKSIITEAGPQNAAISRLMNLSQAARLIPTTSGKKVGTATLWRWCTKGVAGCKLRHYRFGRRICISEEDLLAFGQQVAEAFTSEEQLEEKHYTMSSYNRRPRQRTATQRERDIAAAEQRLRERGVL